MTREEEISNAVDTIIPIPPLRDGRTYEQALMATGFEAGVKWADAYPKSPWISTDKYLPKQGGHYLCNDGDSHISTLAFRGDKWVNTRTFNDIPLEVVKYWMPIPKLPKKEIKL